MCEYNCRAQRHWPAWPGLRSFGAAIALMSLIAPAGLEANQPTALMIVERLAPHADPPGWIVQRSIEPIASFQTLAPADVWLTWEYDAAVGVDLSVALEGSMLLRRMKSSKKKE